LRRWLAVLIIAAITIRAAHHFRTPLVPGVDAAYYLIQTRALLDRGTLAFADLPFMFWLQAGFAWLIQHLTGISQSAAIITSVKLLDSLLPPLAAWPMGLLGWRWYQKNQPSLLPALVPAAAVCISAPMLRMTGDFQKNALALVWLALLMLSAHTFLRRPGWRTALLPLLALVLCGVTHVGVLGAAIVFAALLLGIAALTLNRTALMLKCCLMESSSGSQRFESRSNGCRSDYFCRETRRG